ncbi:zinc finger protein 526-like isoform X2 [Lethenteron reissneri]|uniref:zinc finger protein 526-like isoform X2 n=1 Tax=Lethenteron reissneri TaxID=7753 RepID=UPI002AB7F039|nr:zinc finger protein 526-like isoform X2 [Lethenteron reissneri]
MRGPRASHRAASPRDRTAPQMASPLPAPPPPLIKQETDDEESPANGMSPDLPVKREDAAADDGDDEEAGAVVKQEEGEGRLGREIVRTLVKGEVEEDGDDAPDLKIVKVEDATEISDSPDHNFVEVELSEDEDVGGDGAGPRTEPRSGRLAATTTAGDAADSRRHVCTRCGRGFARHGDLRNHAQTHVGGGGEKPHACGDCGRAFSHRYLLEIHALVHTGERPHVCGDCGRGFVRSGDLRKHVRTHAAGAGGSGGEDPHACGDCGRAFSHRHLLEIHAAEPHGRAAARLRRLRPRVLAPRRPEEPRADARGRRQGEAARVRRMRPPLRAARRLEEITRGLMRRWIPAMGVWKRRIRTSSKLSCPKRRTLVELPRHEIGRLLRWLRHFLHLLRSSNKRPMMRRAQPLGGVLICR